MTEQPQDPLHFRYPEIEPDGSGLLDVGDGHQVCWDTSGVPEGVPVLFVHGGPGGAPWPIHRRFYDPDFFRLTMVHQRGWVNSRPLAGTRANDTKATVAGRYDVATPVRAAWLLHKAWPSSTITIVPGGAHEIGEPPMARAVLNANERMKEFVR